MSARPDADIVVLAHAGLDLLVTPAAIWHAIPVVHRPMSIHWWMAESATILSDRADILTWMDGIRGQVDAWVEVEHQQPVLPTPPLP